MSDLGLRALPAQATKPRASAGMPDGRVRAVIDAVLPTVDGGRFAAKRIAGRAVRVEAHCLSDGHDRLRSVLRWRALKDGPITEVEMLDAGNDVWLAEFTPVIPGRYQYTVQTWVDHFESWRCDFERRIDPEDVRVALQVGANLIDEAAQRAVDADASALTQWAAELRAVKPSESDSLPKARSVALEAPLADMMRRYADRSLSTSRDFELIVDRARAAYSSWYELFPRSANPLGAHGTFRDVEGQLAYISGMGFDVLYLPPIHPIGQANRKGRNNALQALPKDVGSPWAIGAKEGGHKAILPQLGSSEDFRHLVSRAHDFKLEIALDIAFQCAPDHPYVQQHPQWFRHRPDGSVQYAENPPKKYQDIYPFDFETADWRALWHELRSVFQFWIEQGVTIFRVDNPHTKSFAFWEWVIASIKQEHPEVLFLAEAFTRPKVMHWLAKIGFSQSYTYFTWRTSKRELTQYFTELNSAPGRDYFRPNLWPNTPDILHETLQSGLRSVFESRLILAATLSANYGLYGPAYELLESTPRDPGGEEYLNSEKYQLRQWQLDRPDSLAPLITRLNSIRRDNVALQSDASLRFCTIDNDQLIAYLKYDPDSDNAILTVVNLDPHHVQSGWLELDLSVLHLEEDQMYQAHDLLSEQRFVWRGRRNFVRLDPARMPGHVLRLRRHMRTERDFDYFV